MKAVIFDLDGTLIDSAPDIAATANRVLTEAGLATLPAPVITSFVGHGARVLIARCVAEIGAGDVDSLLIHFVKLYEQAFDLTALYPNVVTALTALQMVGHPMAVCTNKPLVPAQKALEHFGLVGFFPVVIGGDSLNQRKPDPEPLHHAARLLGTDEYVFVGDSEVDAETAARAEAPFFLFTLGYRKAPISALPHTVAFENFADLPGLIAQHRA